MNVVIENVWIYKQYFRISFKDEPKLIEDLELLKLTIRLYSAIYRPAELLRD